MKTKTSQFIQDLAALCRTYNARIFYLTSDDGLHVSVDDKDDVCIGFDAAAPCCFEEPKGKP